MCSKLKSMLCRESERERWLKIEPSVQLYVSSIYTHAMVEPDQYTGKTCRFLYRAREEQQRD